ncbi:hypothetical protein WR25_22709 [Diploscapter pachys]|uniref:Uncharacterized protein n=1 Tax=Diploscapter pachys TaxID=2018661 RepID=A0A2A2M0K6_9BILA|nr:hypothetical protein WR25_22709 [Diploscapter pachys]
MLDLSSGMPIYNLDEMSDSHNYHQSNDFSPEQRPSWLFSNPVHPQSNKSSELHLPQKPIRSFEPRTLLCSDYSYFFYLPHFTFLRYFTSRLIQSE